MRYLATGMQMQKIDAYTIEKTGIPSLVLMERAALSVVEQMEPYLKTEDRILVACGTGNNGADGIAVARMLHLKGYAVSVIWAGSSEKASDGWKRQHAIGEQVELPMFPLDGTLPEPDSWDVVVDAIFGVGLSRPVEGIYAELLLLLDQLDPRFRVAVDLPSGISADNGQVLGVAFHADLTVTFGYEKLGTVYYPGKAYAGRTVVCDIGFPPANKKAGALDTVTFDPADLCRIPERKADSNKGTFGKVLIVAGSKNMSGAAYLSALAAYRTGAGLVRILTVEENRVILQSQLPEAVLETYEPEMVISQPEALKKRIAGLCGQADVVVLGPGLGRGPHVEPLVESVLSNTQVPLILDADGLNTVASCQRLAKYFSEQMILTPHLGEFERLTGHPIHQVKAHLLEEARTYAKDHGITCVLKDTVTTVAGTDGSAYVNTSGNSAMAKAGSGDVLTGVIAGLIALGLSGKEAASLGVYLHGLAGDYAREKLGEHGLLARDLAEHLNDSMKNNRGRR